MYTHTYSNTLLLLQYCYLWKTKFQILFIEAETMFIKHERFEFRGKKCLYLEVENIMAPIRFQNVRFSIQSRFW